jgi:hypothetical protein
MAWSSAGRRSARTHRGVAVVVMAAILVLLAALVTLGFVGSSHHGHGSAAGGAPCQLGADMAPTCGAWWGEALDTTDTSLVAAVDAAQTADGRRLDIVHTYHRWDDVFPTPAEQFLARSGHLLFLNWQPTAPNGSSISWASIASGTQNATIDAEAARLRQLGQPVLMSFSHEPDNDLGRYGSAAQFVAAYRYVHNRVVGDGATNVRWVWTVEGIDTAVWQARYRELWPGNGYVDWISWDPYNFASCTGKPWLSFSAMVAPFYQWLSSQPFGQQPLMLAEYGTITQGGADTKQAWYAGESAALSRFPRLKALVYFNYDSPPATCDWRSTSSSGADDSFASLAQNVTFAVNASLTP